MFSLLSQFLLTYILCNTKTTIPWYSHDLFSQTSFCHLICPVYIGKLVGHQSQHVEMCTPPIVLRLVPQVASYYPYFS